MLRLFSNRSLLLLFSISLFASCKKDIRLVSSIPVTGAKDNPTPPFDLDWENLSYMPSNPANVIPMPWDGTVGGVNGYLVSDYKKSDGWKLVYNTFNYSASPYLATLPPGGLYFAIYNELRGILRFYLYLPTGIVNPSSSIAHGLSLYPQGSTASSMLNFESSDLVELGSNTSAIMKTNNQKVNILGNWLAMEYEIAYDPGGTQPTNYPTLGLQWNSQSINITKITLNGTETGTITGQITTPSSGFNVGQLLGNLVAGAVEVYGLADLTGIPTDNTSFKGGLQSALSGGLGNSIGGLFSAIFGGNSDQTQEVKLNMNANINITGDLTNATGITNPFMVIPGQANDQTYNGPIPAYNNTMGLFNLTQKPVVNVNYTTTTQSLGGGAVKYIYNATYSIVPGTASVVINPVAQSLATISPIAYQIVLINPITSHSTTSIPWPVGGFGYSGVFTSNGNHELIGSNYDTYTNVTSSTTQQFACGSCSSCCLPPVPIPGSLYQNIGVRVIFTVTPNNGTTHPFQVAKTFLATVTHN